MLASIRWTGGLWAVDMGRSLPSREPRLDMHWAPGSVSIYRRVLLSKHEPGNRKYQIRPSVVGFGHDGDGARRMFDLLPIVLSGLRCLLRRFRAIRPRRRPFARWIWISEGQSGRLPVLVARLFLFQPVLPPLFGLCGLQRASVLPVSGLGVWRLPGGSPAWVRLVRVRLPVVRLRLSLPGLFLRLLFRVLSVLLQRILSRRPAWPPQDSPDRPPARGTAVWRFACVASRIAGTRPGRQQCLRQSPWVP